jgi:hypothetical protein
MVGAVALGRFLAYFSALAARGRGVARIAALALAAGLVLGSLTPAYAQVGGTTGNINGSVTNNSGAPVANATVALASPSGTYTQHTDSRGYFSFLGVPTDTYTLSVEAKGFSSYSQTGINVAGGNTLALGSLALAPENAVIGTVTAHSLASAFQPNQTIPQYTLSGNVLQAAAGKAANANEQGILLSVPGFQIDSTGNLILQGATRDQIRYQFDGVDFTDPGFSFNANNAFFNGIASVQVVSGAGDPAQPNGGAGSVNLLVKRGTYPAGGLLDLELNDRPEGQQINFQYGAATSNGRFSDFLSYFGDNGAFQYGPFGSSPYSTATLPYLNQRNEDSDFVNNFVFRFGRDNAQSLQVLYLAHATTLYGNYAGMPIVYDNGDPTQLGTLSFFSSLFGPAATPAQVSALLSPEVGQTYVGQPIPAVQGIDNASLLKFEYDNQISASTNLALRYFDSDTYAFEGASGNSTTFGAAAPLYGQTSGGSRVGANFDLTQQIGEKQTLTFSGDYEINHPNFGTVSSFQGFEGVAGNWIDFLRPPNPNAPVSAGNPCPVAGGCYLQQFFYTKGGTPPIPNLTLASSTPNIQFGSSLRDEIQLTHALRLDLGVRYDIFNQFLTPGYVYSEAENTQPVPGNPGAFYVPNLGFTNQPHFLQPRIGISYLVTPRDTVAATYGKSINIGGNGLYASPESTSYLNGFANIPVNPNWIAGPGIFGNPDAPAYSASGVLLCNTTVPYPINATANSQPSYNGTVAGPTPTLQMGKPCANYAQALQGQQDVYFPEIANVQPAVLYNNDLSYAHVFGNGMAMKIDGFNRQAFHVQQITAPLIYNPVTQTTSPGSLSSTTNGFNNTTGVDLNLTLPDHPYGFTGFVSATYTNELTNTPAAGDNFAAQDFEPYALPQFAALNNVYRAGFVSPLTLHIGLSYKTRTGWRFNPVVNVNDGYPYNSGSTTPYFLPGSVAVNVPNTNVTDPYIGATGGNPYFVDPANPGSIFAPVIAAARGNKEGYAGTQLSPPQATMDFTIEFTPPSMPRSTFGIQFLDVFNNGYFLRAVANPNYFPVATGVSGPLTGQSVNGLAGYPTYASIVATNTYPYAPYIIPLNLGSAIGAFPANNPWENLPFTFRVYYQLKL